MTNVNPNHSTKAKPVSMLWFFLGGIFWFILAYFLNIMNKISSYDNINETENLILYFINGIPSGYGPFIILYILSKFNDLERRTVAFAFRGAYIVASIGASIFWLFMGVLAAESIVGESMFLLFIMSPLLLIFGAIILILTGVGALLGWLFGKYRYPT